MILKMAKSHLTWPKWLVYDRDIKIIQYNA